MAQGTADAIFILGDLFEVWIGDDDPDAFGAACLAVLSECSAKKPVFFMHGNRDFLVGPGFTTAAAITLLLDPSTLLFGGQRWLLSHGDALCVTDLDYQKFRHLVRSNDWQRDFLARPLGERQQIARDLRDGSEQRKAQTSHYADVDPALASAWLKAAQASHLIHGHTHRPGDSVLPGDVSRSVLSDWDLGSAPPRAQVFRLALDERQNGITTQRLTPDEATLT